MSGGFIYSEDVLSSKSAPAPVLGKGLKRVLLAAAVVIGAELIWLFIISPCMPLSTVEIIGYHGLDRSQVLALAGIDSAASWFTVNTAKAEKELENFYLIDSAKVLKRFPDRVKIFIYPRVAAAMTLAPVNGRLTPVYFDDEGVIFNIGQGEPPLEKTPIISGIVIEDPRLGMRLPAVFSPFLANIEKINNEAPDLLQAVSEIRINRKPFDGFDLILYPVHNPVKVRLEPEINEDILRYVMLVIDVFASRHTELEEIDFRTGTALYTIKEAYSGE
jgi:cell division protein FtsQ